MEKQKSKKKFCEEKIQQKIETSFISRWNYSFSFLVIVHVHIKDKEYTKKKRTLNLAMIFMYFELY